MIKFKITDESINEIIMNLRNMLGDNVDVRYEQVTKNNGLLLDGIVLKNNDSNIGMCLYLNNYDKSHKTTSEIADDIFNTFMQSSETSPEYSDLDFILDYEKVKSKLMIGLADKDSNIDTFNQSGIPYKEFLDMIVFCRISIKYDINDDKIGTVKVSNSLLKKWNVTFDDIISIAENNTWFETTLFGMTSWMMSNMLRCDDAFPTNIVEGLRQIKNKSDIGFVMSNEDSYFGAAEITNIEMMKTIAKAANSNLLVIPSSIHEVIIIPDYSKVNDISSDMIRSVNDTMSEDEILSEHSYIFNKDGYWEDFN